MFKKWTFWRQVLLSWIIFIGIDFFFHAGVTNWLWSPEIAAFKPEEVLFRLIPAGYGSFLLLVILIAYIFNLIKERISDFSSTLKIALAFGLLFSGSYFLGLFSFVNIPLLQLAIFSSIYLIEILATFLVLYYHTKKPFRKLALSTIGIFILLIVLGIITQNIIQNMN